MGYQPFIVAAMGSHGGATADGQRELLAGYGVTSEAMGVPVKTDMDTVVLGTNPVGLPIYFDQNAYRPTASSWPTGSSPTPTSTRRTSRACSRCW